MLGIPNALEGFTSLDYFNDLVAGYLLVSFVIDRNNLLSSSWDGRPAIRDITKIIIGPKILIHSASKIGAAITLFRP